MNTPVERILAALESKTGKPARRNGKGCWTARCPAHDDRNPSLSIADGDDPPALLARRVLALERGGPECDALLEEFSPRLEQVLSQPRWQRLW